MKLFSVAAALCGLGLSVSASAQPMEAVLRLKERVPMSTLAHNVLDPASPRYRQYYTPAEIRSLAGPSDAEYQTLLQTLGNEGLKVVSESPTHLVLTVRADSKAFSQLFRVKFSLRADKTRAVSGQVMIPRELSLISSVVGLDNQRHVRPLFVRANPNVYPLVSQGVSLAQVRSLYGFDELYQRGLSGKGQHIAIATYNDIDLSVVTSYYQKYGVSPAPKVDKVTFNGTPPTDENAAMETAVDAEFSGAIAPGAQIHVFTSAHNDDGGELAMFSAILDDNRAKIVNYSWGGCESDLSEQHKTDMAAVFERAVAQGVNIMVASGDSGSSCATAVDSSGQPTVYTDPMADWPAAHPGVVAVGGTTLGSGSALSETAWSGSGADGGGGGGISTLWDLPSWQADLGDPYVKRSYPDVAFNANPSTGETALVLEFGFPFPAVIGGTSIAAPQWAGFLALVGEARAAAGKSTVGFLNPIIYGMSPDDRGAAFDDVTSGDIGKYEAGAGWDAATGWGGPHAPQLLDYLVAY